MPGTNRRARAPSRTTTIVRPSGREPGPRTAARSSITDKIRFTSRATDRSSTPARTRTPPAGTHVRQPPYPVPSTPRPDRVGRISQNHQVQLSRGMQARALSDHPPGRHTSPRPSHTDNPQPAQRHTDGHISHRPPQRLLIRGPLGNTQLHPTGHISRAHTHIEPVLIVRRSHNPARGPLARNNTSAGSGCSSRR